MISHVQSDRQNPLLRPPKEEWSTVGKGKMDYDDTEV